jgi:signal transduction histidine kinase
MRLVVKELIFNLPAIIIVVALGGGIFYQSIESVLETNEDEVLKIRKQYIIDLLDNYKGESPFIEHAFADIYEIEEEDVLHLPVTDVFSDTVINNPKLDESILYRQLRFQYSTNGRNYMVWARTAEVDNDEVLQSVITTIVITCLLMAVVISFLNVYFFRKIWMPFHGILSNLTRFNLDGSSEYVSAPSSVKEFQMLDATLREITSRLQSEYDELKDFTSYLTHELQTPLAVVNGKIDLLIQDQSLSEDQLRSLVAIRNTIQGISEFEKTLIFLKRIELGQFNQMGHIDFSATLTSKLEQTEELIKLKKISLKAEIVPNVMLDIHPQLIDTLLNNIISNSIRHNIKNGFIEVKLTPRELKVTNSTREVGELSHEGADFISIRGLGVGASIIKAICNRHQLNFKVVQEDNAYSLVIGLHPG